MKQLLFSLAICFALTSNLLAQTSPIKGIIKGVVIDSAKNQPIAFATVLLKDAKTNQAVKSTLTKDNGTFEILAVADKQYQLVFAFMGYKTKTINVTTFTSGDKPVADVQQIKLSITNGQLKEVSITEAKPLMKQEVDRISYDVQADPESKAITALDMMRKVPLLAVDANDNIKLRGSDNYKILINGKESALMAKNPSDILKAMPATNIEKIEVITTPPAKYDAEGLAGIINIITKKNADQGYNGSVNGRVNNVYGPGININGTVKQGKFGVAGYAGSNSQGHQINAFGNTQTFTGSQSVINQNGARDRKGVNTYGEFELSYEIDSLNLLTSTIELYKGVFDQNNNQLSKQTAADGTTQQQYSLNNVNHSVYTDVDLGLNYQLGFKKSKDQLLTLSYKYGYSPGKENNDNVFADRTNFPQPNYQQYNNSGNRLHIIQLDYVQPVKKLLNIEAGAKANLRNNFSYFESKEQDATTGEYIVNPNQTNNFNYYQDVYSFYNSYQLKLEKWVTKAGLRIEHTQINANFVTSGSATLDRSYDNLIPSISLQRKFKSSSMNFGFTERIRRPGIWQLNPFVDRSNPKFISTGNPNLSPELNHTFEFTYSNFSKNSITAGLNYAFSNNSIQTITDTATQVIDNQKQTVTTTTYQNLGSNKSLGLNLNTNINFTKKLSLSANAQISHVWLKGIYNGQFYTNEGFVGNAFGNAGYKFDNDYRIGINASYFSGDVNLQGKNGYGLFTSLVGSKEFAKKLTLSLVCNNPYSKYFNFTSYNNTPDFTQSSFNQIPYRTFAIRFNYKFGKLNSEIKKNTRGINDDTKSNGGGNNTGK